MRISTGFMLVAALITAALVVGLGVLIAQPPLPLIVAAGFSPEQITPNADGSDDVALFRYTLARPADVSITLTGADGTVYTFRDNVPRSADAYQVLFSGVVDGYSAPEMDGAARRQLIPDGVYTWRLAAHSADESAEQSGTLTVAEGDAALPVLQNFTVSPVVFTPNQDGIADRVQINVFLNKPAQLTVWLEDAEGVRYYVPERLEDVLPGEAGRHTFDYEGGVDQGADPPPDGTYMVVAEAQDAVGQIVRQTAALRLERGGKPLAQIIPQPSGADVVFTTRPSSDAAGGRGTVARPDEPGDVSLSAITMPVGDLLVFKLTVENYSDVPLRTTGPAPGTIYTQDERAAGIGWYEESGAWRVGIDCENATSDYPWRWALGTDDALMLETDAATGAVYRYLAPGERSVVWGAIRMTELVAVSNPQACWAGLIHEDVEISQQNSRVGPREIELVEVVPEP